MRFPSIRRPRNSGGTATGKFGHSSSKYSKNPKLKNNMNLEGRTSKKRIPIKNPKSSVRDLLK